MKQVRLFEQYVHENIFINNTEKIVGNHDLDLFIKAYKTLHKNNIVIHDKKDDITWGYRKGSDEGHWKYDHSDYKLHSDLNDNQTVTLMNFKKSVEKNHPWSK
jgi:mRNA-degrading endonuclease RelE of RelBE toxin-antitoxin system